MRRSKSAVELRCDGFSILDRARVPRAWPIVKLDDANPIADQAPVGCTHTIHAFRRHYYVRMPVVRAFATQSPGLPEANYASGLGTTTFDKPRARSNLRNAWRHVRQESTPDSRTVVMVASAGVMRNADIQRGGRCVSPPDDDLLSAARRGRRRSTWIDERGRKPWQHLEGRRLSLAGAWRGSGRRGHSSITSSA